MDWWRFCRRTLHQPPPRQWAAWARQRCNERENWIHPGSVRTGPALPCWPSPLPPTQHTPGRSMSSSWNWSLEFKLPAGEPGTSSSSRGRRNLLTDSNLFSTWPCISSGGRILLLSRNPVFSSFLSSLWISSVSSPASLRSLLVFSAQIPSQQLQSRLLHRRCVPSPSCCFWATSSTSWQWGRRRYKCHHSSSWTTWSIVWSLPHTYHWLWT